MGAVKVTVSAGWFITPPRPWAATVGQMMRRALSVMVASKLCIAKCRSYSGRFSQ